MSSFSMLSLSDCESLANIGSTSLTTRTGKDQCLVQAV